MLPLLDPNGGISDASDISVLVCTGLRRILQQLGEPQGGDKAALVARLSAAVAVAPEY